MNPVKLAVQKVVFIGAGNMAEALVRGLTTSGTCSPSAMTVTDVRSERLSYFERSLGVRSAASNREAVRGADIVVLAIKPQVMGEVLSELRGVLEPKTLVISIAAGVPTVRIEAALGAGVRVVRVMPNTPALVRAGVSALCLGRWAGEADLQAAEVLMGAAGITVRVPERDMDAVTAISGSGPAYVFYLMEALAQAAQDLQLEPDIARRLIGATVEGAAKLLNETGLDPATLRERVTSKGGTTEAALRVLEDRRVREALVEAVRAAWQRAAELSHLG